MLDRNISILNKCCRLWNFFSTKLDLSQIVLSSIIIEGPFRVEIISLHKAHEKKPHFNLFENARKISYYFRETIIKTTKSLKSEENKPILFQKYNLAIFNFSGHTLMIFINLGRIIYIFNHKFV